jgi:hypothetical protein
MDHPAVGGHLRPLTRLVVAALGCGVILVTMAGCGSAHPEGGTGAPGSDSSTAGSGAAGSAGSAVPQTAALSGSAADEPTSVRGCKSGRVELSYRLDGPKQGRVCVRAGAELIITLRESPGYAWSAVESMSPRVVTVSRSSHGASATATARATHAGMAELRWTSQFTGDRFGPPTRLWRLTVTVVP